MLIKVEQKTLNLIDVIREASHLLQLRTLGSSKNHQSPDKAFEQALANRGIKKNSTDCLQSI